MHSYIMNGGGLPIFLAQEIGQQLNKAAQKIQAQFRGYRERKQAATTRESNIRWRSAIIIQRAIRKWLQRVRERKHMPPAYSRPPGLTEVRRVELQEQIRKWREDNPV